MNNFPFKDVVTRALKFTWQNKWLWVLGLFIVGPFGSDVFSIVAERLSVNQSMENLGPAWRQLVEQAGNNPPTALGVALLILLALALFVFLNGLAEPAIVRSAADQKEQAGRSLRKTIAESVPYVKRIIGLRLANVFAFVLVGALLAAPVYFLYKQGSETSALYLLLVALVIFMPFIIFVSFVLAYAGNFIALANMKLGQAVKSGLDLAARFWVLSAMQAALIALIYFVASAIFALAVTLGGLFFRGLIFLADNTLNISLDAFSNIAGAILLGIIGFAFAAVASVWQTAVWTYTWQELVKMQKAEEKKVEPEAVKHQI